MPGTRSLNLPQMLKQAEAAYRAHVSRSSPAEARAPASPSSFVRLSLDEPEAMRRMQEVAGKLRGRAGLDGLLPEVLDGALALTGADFGNVQLVDPATGALRIVTQCGFDFGLTDRFAVLDAEYLGFGKMSGEWGQIVIADVSVEPLCEPYREIAASAGFRAVQLTPLADSGGLLVGVVLTHFRAPGRPHIRDLQVMELYCDVAGEAIARQLDRALRDADPCQDEADEPEPSPYQPTPAALAEFAGETVQRLFLAGLSLASARAIAGDGPVGDRVTAATDEIDHVIRDTRAMVFGTGGCQYRRADG